MGMFDDLIPAGQQQSAPAGGMFDDLIPTKTGTPGVDVPYSQPAPVPAAVLRDKPNYTPAPVADSGGGAIDQFTGRLNAALGGNVGRAIDNLVIPHDVRAEAEGAKAASPVESWIRDAGRTAPVGEPRNYQERIAGASGNFVGENLPFMAAGGGLAHAGVRFAEDMAPGVMNTIKGGVNTLLDKIAANPVRSTAGELIAASEAGGGGEIVKEQAAKSGYGPAGQKNAETLGQMAAPTVADYLTGTGLAMNFGGPIVRGGKALVERGAKELGSAIPDAYRPSWLDSLAQQGHAERADAARGDVGHKLTDILAQPDTQQSTQETQNLQTKIPGFKPGLARASGDQGLINTQQSFDTEATGPDLRKRQQSFDQSAQAVRDKLESAVPQPDGNTPAADVVGKAVQQRVGAVQGAVGQEANATRQALQDKSDSLPTIDRSATGAQLRDIRATEKTAADQQVEQLKGQIGDPNTPITVGTDKGGNPITQPLKQVMDRQAAINQELRAYRSATSRSVDDVKAMGKLQDEKSSLDDAIDESAASLPGLKAFRDYYRDEYVPRFNEGASRDVGRYNQFGYDKQGVASEDVPSQWFQPNNISGAKQFNKLYGNNPDARQAMSDYALDDLRHTAVDPNTGLIKDGAVNRWLTKNERVLNEMPWVRDAVASKDPGEIYDRLGRLEQRQRQLAGKELFANVLPGRLAKVAGQNPDQIVDSALDDWRIMRGLKRSVQGDPQAEAALKRAVWDRVVKSAGLDTLVNPDKLQKFITDNKRSLQEVLDPEHLKNIDTVVRAAQIQNRAPRPTGTVQTPLSIPDQIGQSLGVTPASAVASGLAIARGRSSPWYEGIMQSTRFLSRQKQNATKAAWNEALQNPDMAKQMADIARSGPTPLRIRKMYAYLVTAGLVRPDAGTGN